MEGLEGTSWHSYPKVWNLGHPNVADIFNEEVVVEEKVDGSQFSFGKFNGELHCRSKGAQIIVDNPDNMFQRAVGAAKERLDLLPEGWTFRAEYLSKPKHNVLCYNRVPRGHLILFDINRGFESYVQDRSSKAGWASDLGLELVPELFRGTIQSADDIHCLLDNNSILGGPEGPKVEGIVVKNYHRFNPHDGKTLMGKFVSEAFKERHSSEWKKANPTGADRIASIGQALRTEARWAKAVQHLREQNLLTQSPKDIGALLKELATDTKVEEEEAIKQELFKYAWPKIQRIFSSGFPDWYKDQLLEDQFREA